METEDFAANRTMQKDLKSFACKPLGLTHKWINGMNWWTGWHFAWLFSGSWGSGLKLWKNSICFSWTRTACRANMWAPDPRMSLGQKHPKAWWKYGSTKGVARFCIYKTTAKALNSRERNLMHWIPLRFPDMLEQLTQASRVCFLCHSATSSHLRREFETGLVKRRKYQGQFCYCVATVSYSILVCGLQLVAPAWFLETHRWLEPQNKYLIKVCWCKGREDNQANKMVEDHALLFLPQLM